MSNFPRRLIAPSTADGQNCFAASCRRSIRRRVPAGLLDASEASPPGGPNKEGLVARFE
jgi:hypothetical protein